MSVRLFTSFVIISLLVGCVFMLVHFRKLQQQKAEAEELCVHLQEKAQDQLNTYQSNLETAISNSNLQLENQKSPPPKNSLFVIFFRSMEG